MAVTNLAQINRQIYQRFPEVDGVQPKKQSLANNTLLIYQATVTLPGGKTMKRMIRVTVDSHGSIIKVSSSR